MSALPSVPPIRPAHSAAKSAVGGQGASNPTGGSRKSLPAWPSSRTSATGGIERENKRSTNLSDGEKEPGIESTTSKRHKNQRSKLAFKGIGHLTYGMGLGAKADGVLEAPRLN